MQKVGEQVPEEIKNILIKRAKESDESEFDLESEIKGIINKEIELYNHYMSNERFRKKFSELMFEQFRHEGAK